MKNNSFLIIGVVVILLIAGFVIFNKPPTLIPTENLPVGKATNFNFIFRYGVGAKNELNTFEKTYTKDMAMGPSITVPFEFSDNEYLEIQNKINELSLWQKNPEPNKGSIQTTPCSNYYLKIQNDEIQKEFLWNNCHGEPDNILVKFTDYILPIIQSKEAYKNLPTPQGGYQ